MATAQQVQNASEIRYLTPPSVDVKRKSIAASRRTASNILIIRTLNS